MRACRHPRGTVCPYHTVPSSLDWFGGPVTVVAPVAFLRGVWSAASWSCGGTSQSLRRVWSSLVSRVGVMCVCECVLACVGQRYARLFCTSTTLAIQIPWQCSVCTFLRVSGVRWGRRAPAGPLGVGGAAGRRLFLARNSTHKTSPAAARQSRRAARHDMSTHKYH